MKRVAIGHGRAKLREGIAHDAAAAGETPLPQFSPDLHGVAAALGCSVGQVLLVDIEQTGAAARGA